MAVVFLTKLVVGQTHHLTLSMFHPRLLLVALGLAAFFMYFFIRSIFWQYLLKAQGHVIMLSETAYLWGISELQRYIPGNIWAIVGRTVAFDKKGVDKKTTAISWLYEAEFLALASIIFSLFSLNFIVYGLLPSFPNKYLVVIGISLAVGVFSVIFLLNTKLFHEKNKIRHILPTFSFSTNTWLLFLMMCASAFFGLGTYFSIASFTGLYPHDFDTFLGFFVFSYLVGYLSLIFPMGVGPREAIMTAGLSRYISVSSAILGAFFSRFVLIAGEIIFLLFVTLWYRFPKAKLQKIYSFLLTHKYFLILILLMTLYTIYFATASILRYDNFFTGRFDLGNMDQTVWNTVHGRIFQLTDPDGTNIISRLSIHADYILVLLAPFYLLWQDPRMLLIIQTIILAMGALFIYLLGIHVTKNKLLGCCFAALFLLNPSVEYSNLYDFHGVVLATTFLLGAFYFLKTRKDVLFVLFLILSGITKEEVWIIVALFGIYAFLIEKRRVLGSFMFTLSSAIFYFVFFKAIPEARHGQHFALTFYSDFGTSPLTIFKTILLSPQKTLTILITKSKLLYLFQLFSPLGFLSLLAPVLLIFILPDLSINLLSNNASWHQIYFQYTAGITPFLFIAAMYGFVFLTKRFSFISFKIWILSLVTMCALASYWYGPLPFDQNPNIDMFWRPQVDREIIDRFLSSIPRRYSIAATNNIGSHLSHRQLIYTIPTGIDKADILVFLLNDKFAQPSLKAQINMAEKLENDTKYVEAIHQGDFVVFEKKGIYPHIIFHPQPNSLFPALIRQIKQSFSGKTTSSHS